MCVMSNSGAHDYEFKSFMHNEISKGLKLTPAEKREAQKKINYALKSATVGKEL